MMRVGEQYAGCVCVTKLYVNGVEAGVGFFSVFQVCIAGRALIAPMFFTMRDRQFLGAAKSLGTWLFARLAFKRFIICGGYLIFIGLIRRFLFGRFVIS